MATSMNGVPSVLEYEVTADDLRRYLRESRTRIRRSWTRRSSGLLFLLLIADLARRGAWLTAAACTLLIASWWFGWVFWLSFWAFAAPYRVRLESDNPGLVMTAPPSRSRQRFWWRSLRAARDEPEGLELDFGDGMVLCIPRKAFATGEQYADFRAQVNDRLAARREVAPAR